MISETVTALSGSLAVLSSTVLFLSLPLSVGLSLFVALLETAFVRSGQPHYQMAAQFWAKILSVNLLFTLATRMFMVSQLGMQNAYFSHYLGDIFALPLVLDIVNCFFWCLLFFSLYLNKLSGLNKIQKLWLIWLLALGFNGSTWLMMYSEAWLQNPVAGNFNFHAYRMELDDFTLLLENRAAISKALHVILACYATAAATVLLISAKQLMRNPKQKIAQSSFKLAAVIGLISTLLLGLGDNTPNQANPVQVRKLNAINGLDQADALTEMRAHIDHGIKAYQALLSLRDDNKDPEVLQQFNQEKADLGYALLVKAWQDDIVSASDQQIALAAKSGLPNSSLLFWLYKLMMFAAIVNFALLLLINWQIYRQNTNFSLKLAYFIFPWSWLASISGWIIAKAGLSPWLAAELLPTFLGISSLTKNQFVINFIINTLVYSLLIGITITLIWRTVNNFSNSLVQQNCGEQ